VLIVLLETSLLLIDDVKHLCEEGLLVGQNGLLGGIKDLTHKLWKVIEIVFAILSAFVNFIVHVSQITIEIVKFE
jgi:hypothetical protein